MTQSSGTIRIEPLKPDDFGTVAAWLSDPAINRWLTAEWRGRKLDATAMAIGARNRRNRFFLVRVDDRPAGLAAFSEFEANDHSAMVWYLLGDTSLGGRGVTTQAVTQLCRLGFCSMGLECIHAMVLEMNVASQRLLTKCGFKAAGRLRRVEHVEGRQVDRLYFDLLPEDMPGGDPRLSAPQGHQTP